MIKTIALDTESFYSNEFGIKQLGTHRYAQDPRCDVYLISICDGTETWAGHPRDFNFSSLEGQILLSHHAAHDQEIYLAEKARGLWPEIKFAEWHCTANMSAYLCNRRSLADAADFLLGVKVSKGMRDWMKGRTWDDAVREGKAEDLLKYARDGLLQARQENPATGNRGQCRIGLRTNRTRPASTADTRSSCPEPAGSGVRGALGTAIPGAFLL